MTNTKSMEDQFQELFEEFVVAVSLLAVRGTPAKEVIAEAKKKFEPLLTLIGEVTVKVVRKDVNDLFDEMMED